MNYAIGTLIRAALEWALKYWPLLAAVAAGILAGVKYLLQSRREKRDRQVLEALPEKELFMFQKTVFRIENTDSIAKGLGRSAESVTDSLNRLRQQGVAVCENGFCYKT